MKNYTSQDITTMDALEHMRYRSQMYLGDIHSPTGHVQLFKEAIDNSADESSLSEEHDVIRIIVVDLGNTYQAIIADYGRGIPLASLVAALTEPRTSGKGGGSYNATAGVFGLGIKATCAMSKVFCGVAARPEGYGVVLTRDLKTTRTDFNYGSLPDKTGTVIFFEPSDEYMQGQDEFMGEGIKELVEVVEFVSSFLPNTTIELLVSKKRVPLKLLEKEAPNSLFNSLWSWPVERSITITNPLETPKQMVKRRNSLPDDELWFHELGKIYGNGPLGYNIQLFLPAYNDLGRKLCLMGSVNRKPIHDHSMHHMAGLITSIKTKLSTFIDDNHIREFFINKYVLPLSGVVGVEWKDAVFGGQTKKEFRDRDFLREYKNHLDRDMKHSPVRVWESLYELISEHLEISFNQYHNKTVLSGKFQDMAGNLKRFSCYRGCRSDNPKERELILVEGSSAGGQVARVRDVDTQSVYYLRGKSINTMKASQEKIRDNDVVHDIMVLLGLTMNSSSLDNLNFNRILILTDADADGYHITTQLVAILQAICPALLSDGHVQVGSPPLYAIKTGRGQSVFLRDETAFRDFMIDNVYTRLLKIELCIDNKHYELKNDKYRDFIFMVMRLGEIFHSVANRLVIEPEYLELLTYTIKYLDPLDLTILCTVLGCDDISFEPETKCLTLTTGNIDINIPMNGLVENIKARIIPELKIVHAGQYEIRVTTLNSDIYTRSQVSHYTLYSILLSIDDKFPLDRYKGLGEMGSGPALKVSSVDPTTRSSMIIIGPGDIDRIYAIMGLDPKARKELVQ